MKHQCRHAYALTIEKETNTSLVISLATINDHKQNIH
jgi:hypothetical protein